MQLMGGQISTDANGQAVSSEVEKAGNVAVVIVTATVPPQGVQQGDKLDCTVSAISAKSLDGGTLMITPMLGPRADRPTVYALAQGRLTIPDLRTPTTAAMYRGCKMEATIANKFVSDDKVTLVLDKDVSRFSAAQYVEDLINQLNNTGLGGGGNVAPGQGAGNSYQPLARAIDPVHIEVRIPSYYRDRPVAFVSLLLDTPLPNMPSAKRVVINEREEVIIIGEDVMMAPWRLRTRTCRLKLAPVNRALWRSIPRTLNRVQVEEPGRCTQIAQRSRRGRDLHHQGSEAKG